MINLLFSHPAFEGTWWQTVLGRYLRPGAKIAVMAFSFRDSEIQNAAEWEALYHPEKGKYFGLYAVPMAALGIPAQNLVWLNYFTDTTQEMLNKIAQADALYFTGGLPDKMYDRMEERGLLPAVRAFDGVVMGCSAGALIQLDRYLISPDDDYPAYTEFDGLGYIRDFGVEVHHEYGNAEQEHSIRRYQQNNPRPVYAIGEQGLIAVEGDILTFAGDVRLFPMTVSNARLL